MSCQRLLALAQGYNLKEIVDNQKVHEEVYAPTNNNNNKRELTIAPMAPTTPGRPVAPFSPCDKN